MLAAYLEAAEREHPDRCNVIGTLGNHDFDGGEAELLRLLRGGNAAAGPFLENPYRSSRVPYVCSNVRDRRTGRLILPPYAVAVVGGIPVGVIGAGLDDREPRDARASSARTRDQLGRPPAAPQVATRPSSSARSRALRVREAARANSARASSNRPSFSSRSPRTLGSR